MLDVAIAQPGLDRVWDSENIAIVVLMVVVVFSAGANVVLLGALFKMIKKFLDLSEVLNKVLNAINILNERLHPRRDDDA